MTSSAAPLPRPAHFALWLCLLLSATGVHAQQPTTAQPTPIASDEIIRVSTELVQTDVIVFDKQGRFVDNLRAEDFELRVDNKPQTISFFERVKAGSVNEEAQLAAARGGRSGPPADGNASIRPLDRGRTLFFFIDDLHLSADSIHRTQGLLTHFIEEQIGQNDQVAIVTASGQVGFLQQLTDDKDVLRVAINRIAYRERTTRDNDHPLMTPLDAINIQRNDQIVLDAFVEAKLREFPIPRAQAEEQVRARAEQITALNNNIATQTLSSLQNLLRASAQLPGRKLVYFISDGFVFNGAESDVEDRIRRVTDAALRAGVVVYALDAHGLSTGASDLSVGGLDALPDPTGQIHSATNGIIALQEPLRVIAGDTGGRALLNTNALSNAITKALQETSIYYLLAWRPAQEELRGGKFRHIEVSVRARPELTVLVQRGFFNTPPTEAARKNDDKHKRAEHAGDNAQTSAQTPNTLFAALNSFAPKTALPTALTLNYLIVPDGTVLASTVQVNFEPPAPGQIKHIDLVGVICDDQGRLASSFQRRATTTPKPANGTDGAPPPALPFIITLQTRIKPGLYQVRVAARDVESGRTGSAVEWITIPAFESGKLMLSSIFLGTRPHTTETEGQTAADPGQALVDPERRFGRDAVLRFQLYIYNAARAAANGAPDVALQVQVFRDDQPVITAPLRKVATEGLTDYRVLPYAAEIDLSEVPAGRYVLQTTAIDRTAKTSTSQRVKFVIE